MIQNDDVKNKLQKLITEIINGRRTRDDRRSSVPSADRATFAPGPGKVGLIRATKF